MWNIRHSKYSAVNQRDRKWLMPGDRSHEPVCNTKLLIGRTNLTPVYLLQGQKHSVYTCGIPHAVNHVVEKSGKGNLKEDLGNEQLTTDTTMSF